MHATLLLVLLQAQHLAWAPSVQVAKSYAIRTGKPLMIVNQAGSFTGFGGPLNDSRLAELNKYFVCTAVYSTEDAAPICKVPPSWHNTYIFFAEPNGKLLGRMGGLYLPWAMVASAKQILWARTAAGPILKELKSGTADGNTYANASMIYAIRSEFSSALFCLKKAEAAHTSVPLLRRSYLTLGDQYRVDQKPKESLTPFQRAAALSKGDAEMFESHVRLAGSYLRTRDWDRAEAEAIFCRDLSGISDEEREIALNQLARIKANREQGVLSRPR
jgi:hypothetical protein